MLEACGNLPHGPVSRDPISLGLGTGPPKVARRAKDWDLKIPFGRRGLKSPCQAFWNLPGLGNDGGAMLSTWPLQRKLLAFSFAILLPLGLLAYFLVQENVAYVEGQILRDNSATAYVVATSMADYLDAAQSLLTALAQTPTLQANEPTATQRLLRNVYLAQRRFSNLFVVDQTGAVLTSLFWEQGSPPPASQTSYLRQVLQTGKPIIAATRISPMTNEPEILVAVPLQDSDGTRIGILGGTLSLGELKLALTSLDAQQPSTIIVVGTDGSVLIHPDPRFVVEQTGLGDLPPVQAVLQGQLGVMEYQDPSDSETWSAAYAPIPSVGWGVLITRSAELLRSDMNRTLILRAVYFGLAALAAVSLVVVLTRWIVRPVRHLVGRIQEADLIAARDGDLIDATDELQYIADAFQLLSGHLERYLDERVATRAELRRQGDQLQHLLERISHSKEEERRRLALDIHDGVAQFLAIALQETRSAERRLAQDPETALRKLRLAQRLLTESMAEIDRVVFDLRPPRLGDVDLVSAMYNLVGNLEGLGRTSCSLEVRGTPRKLPDDWELAAYRVAQEALHNVNKHADAAEAQVLMEFAPKHFCVVITDDGCGFAVDQVLSGSHSCVGIAGMKERADSIGGMLQLESANSTGTKVVLKLPMRQTPANTPSTPSF